MTKQRDWRTLANQLTAQEILIINTIDGQRTDVGTLKGNAMKLLGRYTGRPVQAIRFDEDSPIPGSWLLATFADDPDRELHIREFIDGYTEGIDARLFRRRLVERVRTA